MNCLQYLPLTIGCLAGCIDCHRKRVFCALCDPANGCGHFIHGRGNLIGFLFLAIDSVAGLAGNGR